MQYRNLTAVISLLFLLPVLSCTTATVKNKSDSPEKTVAIDSISAKKNAENASKIPYNASKEDKLKAFETANYAHKKDADDKEIALILARASFMLADIETKSSLIEKFAVIGKDTLESLNMAMDSPRASYFYATNLGLIVRIEGLFGIKKIPIIINALNNAQRDPSIDQGGPWRSLGMLYLKTPQSLGGDIDKAIDLLEKAAKTYPDHPQNHYFYAEALIEDGDEDGAKLELEKARKLLSVQKWGEDYVKLWRADINKIEKKLK